jgi:hypothetical protein
MLIRQMLGSTVCMTDSYTACGRRLWATHITKAPQVEVVEATVAAEVDQAEEDTVAVVEADVILHIRTVGLKTPGWF